MAKPNRHKNGHPNFLHLGEMLHTVEDGMVAAMTGKQRVDHKLAETEPIRRTGPMGL